MENKNKREVAEVDPSTKLMEENSKTTFPTVER